MQHEFIQTEEQLSSFCTQLDANASISIDTEFIRQKTYYAIPALVQVAQINNEQLISACIDAPQINDWSALNQALQKPEYCLTHSPDQDFEIFDQLFGDWDITVYDTQIAAALLGAPNQISYAQMIAQTINIEIDKSQSRTDWLKRPLSKKQMDYAIADVIHLENAWSQLKQQLIEKDRMHWFIAECAEQVQQHQHSHPTESAWTSVKGIKGMQGTEFAIAASLAQWRETIAIQSDRPRRWMLPDDVVLGLASTPGDFEEYSNKWNILQKNKSHVKNLLNMPEQMYLDFDLSVFDPLTSAQKKKYAHLKQYCNTQAEKLGLDPGVIAKRKTLEKLVKGFTGFLNKENWRHRIFLEYLDEYGQ
jgi:ribonuclease D